MTFLLCYGSRSRREFIYFICIFCVARAFYLHIYICIGAVVVMIISYIYNIAVYKALYTYTTVLSLLRGAVCGWRQCMCSKKIINKFIARSISQQQQTTSKILQNVRTTLKAHYKLFVCFFLYAHSKYMCVNVERERYLNLKHIKKCVRVYAYKNIA